MRKHLEKADVHVDCTDMLWHTGFLIFLFLNNSGLKSQIGFLSAIVIAPKTTGAEGKSGTEGWIM